MRSSGTAVDMVTGRPLGEARDQEMLSRLRDVVIPLAGYPRFGEYIWPCKWIQAVEAVGDQMEKMDSQQQAMSGMRNAECGMGE